jgi:hypothetical protein
MAPLAGRKEYAMNKNRRELINEADKLWSRLVAHGFQHRCILCGQPGTDAHHWLFKRSYLEWRWVIENGIYLCRQHHNEIGQSIGVEKLHALLMNSFPNIWSWAVKNELAENNPRPIRTSWIQGQIDTMKKTADILGIKR